VIVEPPPFCVSPTPYSKSNIGNLLQKFDGDSNQKNYGPKKRAPKPPISASFDETPSWMKKGPAPPVPSSRKSDPIREMELIGRKSPTDVIFIKNYGYLKILTFNFSH
jgi:hypothetical protein